MVVKWIVARTAVDRTVVDRAVVDGTVVDRTVVAGTVVDGTGVGRAVGGTAGGTAAVDRMVVCWTGTDRMVEGFAERIEWGTLEREGAVGVIDFSAEAE